MKLFLIDSPTFLLSEKCKKYFLKRKKSSLINQKLNELLGYNTNIGDIILS
jgi:hypothetical protein